MPVWVTLVVVLATVQPTTVCRAAWFWEARLTPSKMSCSPPDGQDRACVQKAGQTAHCSTRVSDPPARHAKEKLGTHAEWNMICVHDEERTDIVRFLRGDADRVSESSDSQSAEEKMFVSILCHGERRVERRARTKCCPLSK